MNKEVQIKILGLHNSEDDNSEIETVCDGIYGKLGETEVVTYEEVDEDGNVCRSTLRMRDDYIEVTKKGSLTSKLEFELGRITVTEYTTPYGTLSLEFDTKKMEVKKTEDSIIAHVEYAMGICGAHHADCNIDIRIENR